MINVQEFLLKNNEPGTYALVTYNGKTEAVYFSGFYYENELWFLESPCLLYQVCEVDKPIDEFCIEHVKEIGLTDDADENKYIDNFIKPMIIDGFLYEIENFQTSPYLPKEVDDIKIISERECLEWLINNYIE